MNKRQKCINNDTIAYYSDMMWGYVEIKYIEYGIEDYVYCVSGAWGINTNKRYHKLKIYYTEKGSYIRLHGYKIPLSECLRV